jgi:protein-L-isoaspartate O-methyltransferase
MNQNFGIPMTADEYAAQWQENSKFFSENNYYDWMASCLGQSATVVEIGCGSGRSTLALAKVTNRVIAVEVNQTLANAAAKYLNDNSILAEVIRIEDMPTSFPLSNNHKVTIIVSDVFDSRLDDLLSTVKVDAISCWLIGANPALIATHLEKNVESFTGPEMSKYRELIHKRIYDLGISLLEKGGVVHITDRMAIWSNKDSSRLELARHHRNLSNEHYQISKENTFLKRIEKSFATSKIQYLTLSEVNTAAVMVLSSIRAIKL